MTDKTGTDKFIFRVADVNELNAHLLKQEGELGPYGVDDIGWYFWDETETDAIGPFDTLADALDARSKYQP